jgi:FixJ family two-component response regulator
MPLDGKVVAIVDDDPGVRDALGWVLSSWGCRTESYASAEEFIKAASTSEAGCLVLDIQLGDITGVELARHLFAMGLRFPIIFMTGSHCDGIRRTALEFGCVAFLSKPFEHERLLEAVAKALS